MAVDLAHRECSGAGHAYECLDDLAVRLDTQRSGQMFEPVPYEAAELPGVDQAAHPVAGPGRLGRDQVVGRSVSYGRANVPQLRGAFAIRR